MTILPKKLSIAEDNLKKLLKDNKSAKVSHVFNSPSDIKLIVHLTKPISIKIPTIINGITIETILV